MTAQMYNKTHKFLPFYQNSHAHPLTRINSHRFVISWLRFRLVHNKSRNKLHETNPSSNTLEQEQKAPTINTHTYIGNHHYIVCTEACGLNLWIHFNHDESKMLHNELNKRINYIHKSQTKYGEYTHTDVVWHEEKKKGAHRVRWETIFSHQVLVHILGFDRNFHKQKHTHVFPRERVQHSSMTISGITSVFRPKQTITQIWLIHVDV